MSRWFPSYAAQAISVPRLGLDRYREKLQEALQSLALVAPDTSAMEGDGAVGGAATRRTVAVLPFANHTGDSEKDYLCESAAEDVIVALAALAGISVVPKLDAFALGAAGAASVSEIGDRLQVEHVVTGSVQVAGERIRARVSVTRVDGGQDLWSGRIDGDLDDVLGFQDALAERVVAELEALLT